MKDAIAKEFRTAVLMLPFVRRLASGHPLNFYPGGGIRAMYHTTKHVSTSADTTMMNIILDNSPASRRRASLVDFCFRPSGLNARSDRPLPLHVKWADART